MRWEKQKAAPLLYIMWGARTLMWLDAFSSMFPNGTLNSKAVTYQVQNLHLRKNAACTTISTRPTTRYIPPDRPTQVGVARCVTSSARSPNKNDERGPQGPRSSFLLDCVRRMCGLKPAPTIPKLLTTPWPALVRRGVLR